MDHLLALDPGARGVEKFFQPGGARRAAQTLARARRVMVTTGFAVDGGVPETDGPPGAAVLGRALRLMGADVRYVSDAATVPVLAAALTALGERADVIRYPDGSDAARELLAHHGPTHLVAIERPGRARDGTYRTMRGIDVSEWNAPIDDLFLVATRTGRPGGRSHTRLERATDCSGGRESGSRRRWPVRGAGGSARSINRRPVTIGVGDGGNEIGMGNVRARFARGGALAARIASVVRVDHLVVAGVSNWGAYGIVANLARFAARPLLHTPDDERRLVAACVKAGACDGVTRRPEPTVDGLPLDTHAALIELLGIITRP